MTEDEWVEYEASNRRARELMPKCMCACKCRYSLYSPRSIETHTCFSCRVKLHTGIGSARRGGGGAVKAKRKGKG